MSAYPNIITNGIGGSYLANAWMVLRVPGLYVFSLIFVGSLSLLDSYTKRKSPLVVSVIILFGALIAVYSHRNGLGNLLSFVRQIAISGAIIVVLTAFFKLFYARRGY